MKWALSEHGMDSYGLQKWVYEKALQPETAFITSDLTFLYISFAKIFCQNKVKKNCKQAVRIVFKNPDIRCEKSRGMYL